jgi:hypothetical protein
MKTKYKFSREAEREAAIAVLEEPVSRTGEWMPLGGHRQQDQLNTRQNGVTIFAELRGREGRWHLARLN